MRRRSQYVANPNVDANLDDHQHYDHHLHPGTLNVLVPVHGRGHGLGPGPRDSISVPPTPPPKFVGASASAIAGANNEVR